LPDALAPGGSRGAGGNVRETMKACLLAAARIAFARLSRQQRGFLSDCEVGGGAPDGQIASNARAFTMLISCTANEEDKGKK
jgi:hypothetical protein